jgi:hypothetical protein
MSISNTTLNTYVAPVYTSSGSTALTALYFCNTDSANTIQITIHAVPYGGTVSNTTMIYNSISLTAGDTYVIDTEKLILSSGDTIQALKSASTANVSVTVSYVGI